MNIDSLEQLLNNKAHDTTRIKVLVKLGYALIEKDNAKSEKYLRETIDLSSKNNFERGLADGYSGIGFLYYKTIKLDSALVYHNKSLFYRSKLKDNKGIANCYNNIANIKLKKGDYPGALSNYLKALEISERNKDEKMIAMTEGNLGQVYIYLMNYQRAIQYITRSITSCKEIKDYYGAAMGLSNLGICYYEKKNDSLALKHFNESYKLYLSSGLLNESVGVLVNIGSIYLNRSQYPQAEKVFLEAKGIAEKAERIDVLIYCELNLGEIEVGRNNFIGAEYHLKEALRMASRAGVNELRMQVYEHFSDLYLTKKDYKNALDYFKKCAYLKDSLLNDENNKSIAEMQTVYETEKKEKEIALKNAELAIKKTELLNQKTLAVRQTALRNYFIIGFVLMLVIAVVIYLSYRNKKKANEIISQQKDEVEKQNLIIEKQKHIVEEKQHEILDSINYAKRLQEAILPPQELVNKHLPQNFILYKPKDIVAGDFYWFEHIDGASYFAAADSTGHGVPGALVSVVCSNALNRAVNEFRLRLPGEILDKTRELVLETFARSDKEVKDGMDISLVKISELPAQKSMTGRLVIPKGQSLNDVLENQRKHKIDWAGANNPLWYYQNGSIHEITAHKQPIGKTEKPMPFPTHTLELNKGDMLYLFTDGYADQFGGPKGKKFKYKQLEELLLSNTTESMDLQKQKLNQAFDNWKGGLEQIDDVCIIGIKI